MWNVNRSKTVIKQWTVGMFLGLATVPTAHAQVNGYDIVVGGVVSPGSPSTSVQVWADWDSAAGFYAFAAAEYDLLGDATGSFSAPTLELPDLGQFAGTPAGGDVLGVVVGQLHFPTIGAFADTSDPLLVWSGTWSTTDFTPRLVDLTTDTFAYSLYLDATGASGGFLPTVVEGMGRIQVVPAPASLALIGLGVVAALRRRGA